ERALDIGRDGAGEDVSLLNSEFSRINANEGRELLRIEDVPVKRKKQSVVLVPFAQIRVHSRQNGISF
ncbi:MAG TPA: hypothetical protein VFK23_03540, partial [Nitrospirota bacterium]|nr:hypothetical protein [Nitrospirota bacterium]